MILAVAPSAARGAAEPAVSTYTTGLAQPWSLVFLPGGGALVSERQGRVRVLAADGSVAGTALTKEAGGGEGGTLGLAVDPQFDQNRHVYLYRTVPGNTSNQVLRYRYAAGQLTDEQVVLAGIPAGQIHDGGRLRFGPDGFLYISTGDAGRSDLAQVTFSAGDPRTYAGKILRLAPAGYRGDGAGLEAVSLGHRNPQGLAFQPGSNRLYASEHGPEDDDEINLIMGGGNHGWPSQVGLDHADPFVDPLVIYSPSLAPSGATFVSRAGSAWTGDLLVGGLAGQRVQRLRVDGRRVTLDEELFRGRFGRIRDVVEGPDGALYLLTGNGDDSIVRVVPPAGDAPGPTGPSAPGTSPGNAPQGTVATGGAEIDAFGDVLAYSSYDPAAGAWRLMIRRGSAPPAPAGVPPRSVPFDVDLGPGPDGGVVAAYSRCGREATARGKGGVLLRATGRGCDVFVLELDGSGERRLRGASTREASEFLPTVWRDAVGFARVYERRAGRRGRLPYLYVRPLAGGGAQRQPGGSRGDTGLPGPTGLDLYGRRLAFVWEWLDQVGGTRFENERLRSELRLDTVGGDHRLIDRIGSRIAPANLLTPVVEGGRVFAGLRVFTKSRVLRHRIATRRTSRARLVLVGDLTAFALGEGRAFASTCGDRPPPPQAACAVVALGGLDYR